MPPCPQFCVLVAVEAEAGAIIAEPLFSWRRLADSVWDSERFPLRLALSGVGKVLAACCFATYASEAEAALSLGTSGGLGGEAVGSLWLVDEFVEHDMNLVGLGFEAGLTPWEGMTTSVFTPSRGALMGAARRALDSAGLEAGRARSASGDAFISDGRRAGELAAWSGARLVDMESAAIAKLVLLRPPRGNDGTPRPQDFLALRYVSDNADHQARRSWKDETKKATVVFRAFLRAFALGLAAT